MFVVEAKRYTIHIYLKAFVELVTNALSTKLKYITLMTLNYVMQKLQTESKI